MEQGMIEIDEAGPGDRCVCGHDRFDHTRAGCQASTIDPAIGWCDCRAFQFVPRTDAQAVKVVTLPPIDGRAYTIRNNGPAPVVINIGAGNCLELPAAADVTIQIKDRPKEYI